MDLMSVLIVELLFFLKKKELEKCHVYGGKGDNQYIWKEWQKRPACKHDGTEQFKGEFLMDDKQFRSKIA